MRKLSVLLCALLCSSCAFPQQNTSQNKLNQDQLLESYIGQLTLENVKTLTYQTDGISSHGAKFNGQFMDLFEQKAQYLDDTHRADYFIAGLFMIPLDGGEISAFADTVAIKDCSNKYLFSKLKHFLADTEAGKIYQEGQYQLVKDAYATIIISCKTKNISVSVN